MTKQIEIYIVWNILKNERIMYLNFNRNQVKTIHDLHLTHLPTIKELQLECNELSSIFAVDLEGIQNLQIFKLKSNAIKCIHNDAFVRLPKLSTWVCVTTG